MSTTTTITRSEWLKAMGDAEIPIDDGGQTASEVAGELGIASSTARAKLKKLLKEGKVMVGKRRTPTGWVATYKLKGGKKG